LLHSDVTLLTFFLLHLRETYGYDGITFLHVFLDEYLCGVLLKEPILIPLSIFTDYLILDGRFVGLLIESVDFGLPLLYLIIELLNLTCEAVLLIGEVSDLLLQSLALLPAHCLQLLF
jgi:hypothetical protein